MIDQFRKHFFRAFFWLSIGINLSMQIHTNICFMGPHTFLPNCAKNGRIHTIYFESQVHNARLLGYRSYTVCGLSKLEILGS